MKYEQNRKIAALIMKHHVKNAATVSIFFISFSRQRARLPGDNARLTVEERVRFMSNRRRHISFHTFPEPGLRAADTRVTETCDD